MTPIILLLVLSSVVLFMASRRMADPKLRTALSVASVVAMVGGFIVAALVYIP